MKWDIARGYLRNKDNPSGNKSCPKWSYLMLRRETKVRQLCCSLKCQRGKKNSMNKWKAILLSQSINAGPGAVGLSLSLMALPLLYPHICAVSWGRGGKVADIYSKLVNFYRAMGPMLVACCRAAAGPYLCDTNYICLWAVMSIPQRDSSDQTLRFDCRCKLWVSFVSNILLMESKVSGKKKQQSKSQVPMQLEVVLQGCTEDLQRNLRNLRCCWFTFLIWCQFKKNTSESVSGWNKINQVIFSNVFFVTKFLL